MKMKGGNHKLAEVGLKVSLYLKVRQLCRTRELLELHANFPRCPRPDSRESRAAQCLSCRRLNVSRAEICRLPEAPQR